MEFVIDTHAHLDFDDFDADRAQVLQRAEQAGVRCIINPGADIESSRRAVRLAKTHKHIYAAVGIHPHDAKTVDQEALRELRRLAKHPKVVAIGEIGLDYYRNLSPREVQRQAFRYQLELAAELGLPIIVHDRDAHDDIVAILQEWKNAGDALSGVFHAFSGDQALARRLMAMGFYIGIAGPVTFQNARRLAALVKMLPLDRLLIETDCPYLTPHPYRGQRNEPAYVRLVADKVAELKELDSDDVACQTSHNACEVFGIDIER